LQTFLLLLSSSVFLTSSLHFSAFNFTDMRGHVRVFVLGEWKDRYFKLEDGKLYILLQRDDPNPKVLEMSNYLVHEGDSTPATAAVNARRVHLKERGTENLYRVELPPEYYSNWVAAFRQAVIF